MAVRNVSSGKTFVAPCRAPRATRFFTSDGTEVIGDAGEGHCHHSDPCGEAVSLGADDGTVVDDSAGPAVRPNFAKLGALNATSTWG